MKPKVPHSDRLSSLILARHVDEDVFSEASYSPCRQYRYTLIRRFGTERATRKERIAFIGLNPSTATEQVNDPTVRRCIGFARDWGFREFVMLNAFAYRSTDPQGLRTISDPVGIANDEQIQLWTKKSQLVVCCWGIHATLNGRDATLRNQLHQWKAVAKCFGKTQAGLPRHPLYLRKDSPLVDL